MAQIPANSRRDWARRTLPASASLAACILLALPAEATSPVDKIDRLVERANPDKARELCSEALPTAPDDAALRERCAQLALDVTSDTLPELIAFVEQWRGTPAAGLAWERAAAHAFAAAGDDVEALLAVSERFADTRSREPAMLKAADLAWQAARQVGTPEAFDQYARVYPWAPAVPEAVRLRDELSWKTAEATRTAAAWRALLDRWPAHPRLSEADSRWNAARLAEERDPQRLLELARSLAAHPDAPAAATRALDPLTRVTAPDPSAGVMSMRVGAVDVQIPSGATWELMVDGQAVTAACPTLAAPVIAGTTLTYAFSSCHPGGAGVAYTLRVGAAGGAVERRFVVAQAPADWVMWTATHLTRKELLKPGCEKGWLCDTGVLRVPDTGHVVGVTAYGYQMRDIHVWECGSASWRQLFVATGPVSDAADLDWSSATRALAVAFRADGPSPVVIWDERGQQLAYLDSAYSTYVEVDLAGAIWYGDPRELVATGRDGKTLRSFEFPGEGYDAIVAPSGNRAVVTVGDGKAEVRPLPPGPGVAIGNMGGLVEWTSDSTRVVTLAAGRYVEWDAATGKQLVSTDFKAKLPPKAPHYAPDNLPTESPVGIAPDLHVVAIPTNAGHIRIFDGRDGRQLAELVGPDRTIDELALAPDGTTVAASFSNGELWAWTVALP